MRKDLLMSTDLIALHQRRWFTPHWFLMWQVARMPGETIAALFRHCVVLSNVPFEIQPVATEDVEGETVAATVAEIAESEQSEADKDADWDVLEDEKKQQPADAPQ
jgi:hypothetical protein